MKDWFYMNLPTDWKEEKKTILSVEMFHQVIFQNSFWSLLRNDLDISASFSQFFYTYEKPIGWTVMMQLNIKAYKIYQHQKIMLEQIIILNQIQPSEDHVNIHIYRSSLTFQKLITLATWEK